MKLFTMYVYDSNSKALADLKRFSEMNANEDRLLYLVAVGGWEIRSAPVGIIEAIALNGKVFKAVD